MQKQRYKKELLWGGGDEFDFGHKMYCSRRYQSGFAQQVDQNIGLKKRSGETIQILEEPMSKKFLPVVTSF